MLDTLARWTAVSPTAHPVRLMCPGSHRSPKVQPPIAGPPSGEKQ